MTTYLDDLKNGEIILIDDYEYSYNDGDILYWPRWDHNDISIMPEEDFIEFFCE